MPRVATKSFILRVDTPYKEHVAITVVKARSVRVRRFHSRSEKKELWCNFGIATSTVPTRVSSSRWREPLRWLTRLSLVVA